MAGRLEKRWSPEQISRALRIQFPGEPARHLVPETIYQAVYRGRATGRASPAVFEKCRKAGHDRPAMHRA